MHFRSKYITKYTKVTQCVSHRLECSALLQVNKRPSRGRGLFREEFSKTIWPDLKERHNLGRGQGPRLG